VKILITVIVTLAVAVGGILAFGKWHAGGAHALGLGDAPAEATAVRIEPASRGDLVEIVSAPGIIQPKTRVQISARVSARITELPHDEGEHVTKWDQGAPNPPPSSILVVLDNKDLKAALTSATAKYAADKASIDVARARGEAQRSQIAMNRVTLADAERDLRRQIELLASKDISQSTVDQAQTKVDELKAQIAGAEHSLAAEEANLIVLQHQLEASQAEIDRAADALTYSVITSPIDGTVTKVNTQVGEVAVTGTMNNPGTVILEVADLAKMLCVARVDDSGITSIKNGQKAIVRCQAYPDKPFEGSVTSVALAVSDDSTGRSSSSDTTKFFKVEILLNTNGQRIPSGLNADVDIETKRHERIIKVPSQAVLGRPVDDLPESVRNKREVDHNKTLATVVYRFIDGKAVVTPVSVGPSDPTDTLIESGLNEGEPVIVGPYKVLESIKHDQPVKDTHAATQPSTRPAPATRPNP